MSLQEKILGQLRPSNTTATSVYSPPVNTIGIIKSITICNTTGSAVTFRVFLDDDGTTYDESTALFYDVTINANETITDVAFRGMNNSSGNLAVRTSSANALTFTVAGAEVT